MVSVVDDAEDGESLAVSQVVGDNSKAYFSISGLSDGPEGKIGGRNKI